MTRILQMPAGTNRRGFSWIELLVVLVTILVLLAILFPLLNISKGASSRMWCTNNLKQIGLSMHTYHDVHKTLPSAQILDADGNALHSWRMQLLYYIEQQELYEQLRLDEPWDSEHNMPLSFERASVRYCLTADKFRRNKAKIDEKTRWMLTDYQVVVGPKTPFERDRYSSWGAFERGISNTYLVAEMATAVPWFSPVDLPFELLNCGVVAPTSGIRSMGSYHTDGANVVLADGSVNFVENSKSPYDIELLKTMFLLAEPKNSVSAEEVNDLP